MGGSRDFEKGKRGRGGRGALCWPQWLLDEENFSKKVKITFETISFWQNTSISIFKFSPFLYTMKAGQ